MKRQGKGKSKGEGGDLAPLRPGSAAVSLRKPLMAIPAGSDPEESLVQDRRCSAFGAIWSLVEEPIAAMGALVSSNRPPNSGSAW